MEKTVQAAYAATPRRRVFGPFSTRWRYAALAVALLLQGCAIPGFGPVGPIPQTPALAAPSASQPNAESNAGAMTSINTQLLRSQRESRPRDVPEAVRELFGAPAVYTLGPGDVVGVIVYEHPELLPNAGAVIAQQSDPTGVSVAPGFIIGASGDISFPYIGRTRLQGLTEIEATDLITRRIGAFIRDPQVTVRIQAFRSQRTYVEGEVRTPGMQIFTDVPMTLSEAISRAGGITVSGDRSNVTVTRGNRTVSVSLPQLEALGLDASGIPLRNGDLVNVRSRDERRIYVMGEILRPSALQMRNGRLSLNEALGDAGGPNLLTAESGQIYVIRGNATTGTPDADGSPPQVFHLDARNPAALALADRFELAPRDVVYVDHVALVQWNRVVSLILPAAQVVNLGNDATRR